MSVVILYENYADAAVLSGGSWLSGLPLTNLQGTDIKQVARSSDATNASTIVKADLGIVPPVQVGGVVLGPINSSPGSTYHVRSYSDAAFSTLKYDSGVKTLPGVVVDSLDLEWEDPGFWYGINTATLLSELATYIIEIIPVSQSANAQQRYWKIELFDSANAAGHVDAGRLYIGRAFRPAVGYGEDNSFGITTLTDMTESLGGKRTYWQRGIRRTLRLTFKYLTHTEGFRDLFRMAVKGRDANQVFMVPDDTETDYLQERSFLATCKQPPAIQQLIVDSTATVIDIEEVL